MLLRLLCRTWWALTRPFRRDLGAAWRTGVKKAAEAHAWKDAIKKLQPDQIYPGLGTRR